MNKQQVTVPSVSIRGHDMCSHPGWGIPEITLLYRSIWMQISRKARALQEGAPWEQTVLFLLEWNWTQITAQWDCNKNASFRMTVTWALGITDHLKAIIHNSGSTSLSPYLPACAIPTACSIIPLLLSSHTRLPTVLQYPSRSTSPRAGGCKSNSYTMARMTAYKILWSSSKGKALHKSELLLSSTVWVQLRIC